MSKQGAVFVGQIYDIRTKKDGGGRISIDFGLDGLEEIQWAQKIGAATNCSFEIALVPLRQSVIHSGSDEVDHETGEILL